MNYAPQLIEPKLSQTGSYFRNTRNTLNIRSKNRKEHFTKRHWRRKIQKQFGGQFTEFLSQILKDALVTNIINPLLRNVVKWSDIL